MYHKEWQSTVKVLDLAELLRTNLCHQIRPIVEQIHVSNDMAQVLVPQFLVLVQRIRHHVVYSVV